jgi:hypothetical protein
MIINIIPHKDHKKCDKNHNMYWYPMDSLRASLDMAGGREEKPVSATILIELLWFQSKVKP